MSAARLLVVILGPTASGKSALAIALAGKLGGEVISCDSTQVYRHFDIGTGKVPGTEQRGIPHHMVDLAEPEEVFTAGEYRRRAREVLDGICGRGKMPILTAGTGLYLRALLEGLADAPSRSEELRKRLRESVSRRGPGHLHKILRRLDHESASRIAPSDTQKIIRAIEICLLAGEPASEINRRGRTRLEGYRTIKIGLMPPRDALYGRINRRVKAMLESGWIEEVRRLMDQGVPHSAKPFTFIGYAHLRDHLEGGMALENTVQEIQQATRRYAKRQITWFRREPGVNWIEGFGDETETEKQAFRCVAVDDEGGHT